MAHNPVVVGTPAETAISTAGTSHVVNLPSGATGNLLVAVMSKGSAGTTPTVNSLAGWNELLDEAQTLGLYIAWRVADGTEGATTTFTLSSATRGAWIVYEISGAYDPTIQPPQVGTTATGSSTSPDPPSVSVTGGSKDILTIACFGRSGEEADDDTWVTAAPSGFGGLLQKACGTAGTNLGGMVATAHLAETTATADPGAFTSATGAWRAQTIVVHPVPPTQTAVAEVSLASASTPDTRTSHSIKVRARTTAGAGTLRAALYEGATNRSGDLESSALTTSLADYTLAIPDAAAANITDYSNLGIRFWGYAASGGAIVFEVDQLWLEVPAGATAYTLDCQPGSFGVTGAATLAAGRSFNASAGSHVVTGVAATTVVGRAVDAAPDAYAVTGSAATLLADRALSADPGSYSVTGADPTLAAGWVFESEPGSYAVSGVGATVVPAFAVLADPAAYTVAGADADLVYTPAAAYTLDAQPGSYAVSGVDAELAYAAVKIIDAQPGAAAVTGTDATLAFGAVVDAQPGAYAVTGLDAAALPGFAVLADPGAYDVTGQDANTVVGRALNAEPGSFAVSGSDADLVLAVPGVFVLDAQPATYIVTGAAATILATRAMSADPTVYAVNGSSATLFGEHSIAATAATYVITGSDASVVADRILTANPGSVVFTGFNASVGSIFDFDIDAEAGNITVTGAAANLFFEPGLARLTTRGGRIRWNTTGGFRGENHAGRITQTKEGAVA